MGDFDLTGNDNPVSMGTFQDISAEYEGRLKLFQSEKRWRDTFNAVDSGIMLLDNNQNIILSNGQISELVGMQPEAMTGRKCYEVIHKGMAPYEFCPFKKTMRSGKTERYEVYLPHFNKTFLVITSPVKDKEGNIQYIVHVSHDISCLKQTEKMLRHAQKMEAIGTLAGGIAHDFNNILTGMMAYTELAMRPEQDHAKSRRYMSEVLKAVQRAGDLVSQILTVSRQSDESPHTVSVTSLLKESVKMLRASIPPTIDFDVNISDSELLVYASTVNIHQVIMNLCTNAYHAMKDEHGVLTVRLDRVDSVPSHVCFHGDSVMLAEEGRTWVHLEVSDTGCGIPDDIMERIFEPYFTTKKHGDGTGLGLAIVIGIIKQINGHIIVHSEEGKGSSFHVYFPEAEKMESIDKDARQHVVPVDGKGRRIMVVDDENAITFTMKEFFEDSGYSVEIFNDPEDALAFITKNPDQLDIIITDQSMPKLTGIEFTMEIRKILPDIPMIICSGFMEENKRRLADMLGVNIVLKKPVSLNVIARHVAELLDRKGL
jgi:PAS domain S-box-containing protein